VPDGLVQGRKDCGLILDQKLVGLLYELSHPEK
jgi:hypothetical protein